jgi:hypothetical protein
MPRNSLSGRPSKVAVDGDSDGEDEERPSLKRTPSDPSRDRFRGEYACAALALALIVLVVLAAFVAALIPSEGASAPARILGVAGRSGVAGGMSMVINVLAFMWLRTTVNFQQAHVGVGTRSAMRQLYDDGGVARFYRGLTFALVQGPLSRFGDTAANSGVESLLPVSLFGSADAHALAVTVGASAVSAAWRLLITPVDTLKTSLQVTGTSATRQLARKVERHGPCVMWDGGYGGAVASAVGYLPWFTTYNLLNARLPAAEGRVAYVVRHALLGLCASIVSDVSSNGVRVVKVVKQTSASQISYGESLQAVLRSEGTAGLFRGLGTKLIANAMQAGLFSVTWRLLRDVMAPRGESGAGK